MDDLPDLAEGAHGRGPAHLGAACSRPREIGRGDLVPNNSSGMSISWAWSSCAGEVFMGGSQKKYCNSLGSKACFDMHIGKM